MKKLLFSVGSMAVAIGPFITISANVFKKTNSSTDYTKHFFWLHEKNGYAFKNVELPDKRSETMYQIFPSSFADGNGDGKGDLIGVKNKIDYIKKLGISSVWFNPIFDSPSNHRYDVIDDKKIDADLGGEKAFDDLLKELHKNNIKVYLDFVPNHSSDQSVLFKQWLNDVRNQNIKKDVNDYYMPGQVDFAVDAKGKVQRSKNEMWYHISGTPTSRAGLQPGQKNAYFAAFQTGSMPDRNFASKATTTYLLDVANHWLKKGVDGFRVDAVPHIFDYRYLKKTKEWMNEYWEYGIKSKGDALYLGSTWFKYFVNKIKETKKDVFVFGETLRSADEISNFSGSMAQFNDPLYNELFKIGEFRKDFPRSDDIAIFYNNNEQKYRYVNNSHKSEISFVSSHDKNRMSSFVKQTAKHLGAPYSTYMKNIYISNFGLQFTLPDQPLLYYGDEVGLYGMRMDGETTDTQRRLPMPWKNDKVKYLGTDGPLQIYKNNDTLVAMDSIKADDTMDDLQKREIFDQITKLIKFRNENAAIWSLPFHNYSNLISRSGVGAYHYLDTKNKVKYVFVTNSQNQKIDLNWWNHKPILSKRFLDEDKARPFSPIHFTLKPGQTVMLTMQI